MNDSPATELRTPVLWDKRKRVDLDADQFNTYYKSATGFVLSKNNKLALPNFKHKEDGTLEVLNNVTTQLRELQAHCALHDMLDVFSIVQPTDAATGAIEDEVFHLFDDYPRLSISFVANSNQWWHQWFSTEAPWVNQNLHFSYEMLKANTTDSLWRKAQADYLNYPVFRRGGPLMLFLILERIQHILETSLDNLKLQVKDMKISAIPNEDVEVAVSMVKSTAAALLSASRPEKSFVPDDLSETVLKIFQTTSVPDFNVIFKDVAKKVQLDADSKMLLPVWPTVTTITNLAQRTYLRMKAEGSWKVPDPPKNAAFVGGTERQFTLSCFNCGRPGHVAGDCKEPRDESKIAKARAEFMAKHPRKPRADKQGGGRGSRGRGSGRDNKQRTRITKTIEGKPMVLNRKGTYVIDNKVFMAEQQAAREERLLTAAIADLQAPTTPASSGPPTEVNHEHYPASDSSYGGSLSRATAFTLSPDQIRTTLSKARAKLGDGSR